MTSLILVPRENVLSVLPDVQHMLEPAIAQSDGRWDMWSVVSMLLSGNMHLWVAVKERPVAAMVTRIVDYPRMRVLGLQFIGGKGALRAILSHEAEVMDWAQSQGCSELEGYARKGWLRVLDWKPSWTFIRKPINAGN